MQDRDHFPKACNNSKTVFNSRFSYFRIHSAIVDEYVNFFFLASEEESCTFESQRGNRINHVKIMEAKLTKDDREKDALELIIQVLST